MSNLKTLKDMIEDGEKRLKRNIRTKEMDDEQCTKLSDLIEKMKKLDAQMDALKKLDTTK